MKVLFLDGVPIGDKGGGAGFYRIYQYLDYLRSEGIECTVLSSRPSKYYSPSWTPQEGLWHKATMCLYAFPKAANRLWACLRSVEHDIVFLQRDLLVGGGTPFLETLLKKFFRRKIIFDFDDAIYLSSEGYHRKILRIIGLSDHIIAGNSFLKEYALRYNHKVTVIPTSMDTDSYRPGENEDNEKVVIGWIGLPMNFIYLNLLGGVFKKLSERYNRLELKVVSSDLHRLHLNGIKVSKREWSREREIEEVQSFDIGIMPLTDDEWAKGKCGGKALVCMACGVPVVCSAVGANVEILKDGVNGFLARGEDEWVEKLSALIEDKQLRQRIGREGRKTVEQKYSVKANGPKLKAVLEKVYEISDCLL